MSIAGGLPDVLADGVAEPDRSARSTSAGGPAPGRWTRRRFLQGMVAGGTLAAFGGGGYAWGIEPFWVETVFRDMPIPNLPAALAGFRIVQISDLHVGQGVPLSYLGKWIGWVNARQADLVVVTGDLVNHGRSEWNGAAARLLAQLKAKEGVLAVLGNHDWGTSSMGQGDDQSADRVVRAMAAQGVRVLRNEAVGIRRGSAQLHVVGLDDYWGNRFDPAAGFSKVPSSAPCVALSHNPDAFLSLLDAPASWTLAGHTHGGQVSVPLLGPPVLPVRHKQFVAGHYHLAGKHLYVNRGLGWLRRIRFNARPEITEFTLRQT